MLSTRMLKAGVSTIVVITGLAYAQAGWAQEAKPAQAASAPQPEASEAPPPGDEILVTGTRIPRPEVDGNIPGSQVTGAELEERSFTSAIEVLEDIPLVGQGASPIGNAGGQTASLGAAFVDLLDIGTNRTLTLVNGRRFIAGNAGTLFVAENVSGGQVDLNSIPTAFIDRIDTLTVGGAVAYGSDAIAGVVNVILKDDFEGFQAGVRTGISGQGDAFNFQLNAAGGINFASGRGNLSVGVQYNRDDGLQGDSRAFFANNYIAPTHFLNGGVRNRGFAPSLSIDVAGANNGAFLRSSDDGQPGNRVLPLLSGGSILVSSGGSVFQYTGSLPTGVTATTTNGFVGSNQAGAFQSLSGNTQIIPGLPLSGATSAALGGIAPAVGGPGLPAGTFTRFAPSSLPTGVSATQVIAALAPGFNTTGATAAQLNTLALNLLQANRPTARELFAANPNIPINAFLGSFVGAYLDVPNTNTTSVTVNGVTAAQNAFLPRIAVPLRFDDSGNLISYNPATLTPDMPGTLGAAPGGDFNDPSRYTVLRTQQDRLIGTLMGHYDLTDNITFYTENLLARINNRSLRNAASANTIASGTTETATLVMSINNPFLSATSRQTLINAGVPATNGLFALSRTNQDILGDNPVTVNSKLFRTVNGLKGKFALFDTDFSWDASFTYGLNTAKIRSQNLRDVEYALALDSVKDVNGNIVCRAQLTGAATLFPAGVINTALVREVGPDGILVERVVPRVVTAEQIAGCKPLNPFGFNQMSAEAKRYVTFQGVTDNLNEQMFGQVSLATSSLFTLPGGGVGLAINAEWRRERLDYQPDDGQRLGLSRSSQLARTAGTISSIEASAEMRIPIFGEDFTLPLFRGLEINPGIRMVKQSGDAPDVRKLDGTLEPYTSKGGWKALYSLAGQWRPVDDLLLRGNVTRSLRQPSIVELFIGNQPVFATPTDSCDNRQIDRGASPANRRANCEQEVIRLGYATDRAGAANFLNTYISAGQSLLGGFSGTPTLKPERGKSWTIGAVFTPSFIPKLTLSADYINVEVRDMVTSSNSTSSNQLCYDSATFGDSSAVAGVNTCSFFTRVAAGEPGAAFNIKSGFQSRYINLNSLRTEAINASIGYKFDLSDLLGGNDLGELGFDGSAFRLLSYQTSQTGDFTDKLETAGSFYRPKWETQLTTRYKKGGFTFAWTWNWQSTTYLSASGLPATGELQDVIDFPAFSVHDATMQYQVGENFGLQFTVKNIFDNQYAGLRGFANTGSTIGGSGEIDPIGRRFVLSARVKY